MTEKKTAWEVQTEKAIALEAQRSRIRGRRADQRQDAERLWYFISMGVYIAFIILLLSFAFLLICGGIQILRNPLAAVSMALFATMSALIISITALIAG